MWIADLHIHSKYSRATSRDGDAPHLDLWARKKGISLIGTGDFTHPKWREELKEALIPAEDGLYTLKKEYRLPLNIPSAQEPHFIVTGEISTIYKKNGKTRKVHHVIALPGLEEAEKLSHRLEAIGNLHSDGRPILGLDSRDLLEIVLECCDCALYFPAHIWTPHFSLFGAFSGFDTIQECFEDLSPYIHALETGLSSDPEMNRRVSMLDDHLLVSNSDAHSPQKLGREANILSCKMNFDALKHAFDTGEGFDKTIEFYPEEGKYHMDGHRACQCRLTPEESNQYGGKCPICGKKITIGVLHRVNDLSDREKPEHMAKPFESIIPLPELIGEALGCGAETKKAQIQYENLLEQLGPEFSILRDKSIEDIEKAGGYLLGQAISRMRSGTVRRLGGYDGEYGVIQVFDPGEKETLLGQVSMLSGMEKPCKSEDKTIITNNNKENDVVQEYRATSFLPNPEQEEAIRSIADTTAVIAGPGTGKTGTLVGRIAYLIESMNVSPKEITAVTFTRQAAGEMRERLEKKLGKKAIRGMTIGTFHSICLSLINEKPLINGRDAIKIMGELLKERKEKLAPGKALEMVSSAKNKLQNAEALPAGLLAQYQARLLSFGVRDLDDILLEALEKPLGNMERFHYLLVDEFQDINPLQRELIMRWGVGNSLFVIGDPDQSIYGFRGADANCFSKLLALRPGAKVIRLAQNYRSTPEILQTALQVIEHNPGSFRCLHANHPSSTPVRRVSFHDDISQNIWIAKEVARLTGGMDMLESRAGERGRFAFSEIAILCRTHHQMEGIERCLRHDSIPCVVSGREAYLESAANQDLVSFFAFLTNPMDLLSLHQALKGLWNCPDALIQRVEETVKEEGNIRAEAFFEKLSAFDGLSPFLRAVSIILPKLDKNPRDLFSLLAEETNRSGKDTEQLLNAAVFFQDIGSFLSALQSGEDADIRRLSGGKASGAVSLMTLHASKGLEFPIVIIAGINDKALPMQRIGEDTDLEEERRLFYVGITRAKKELILTSAGVPSLFMKELPNTVKEEKPSSAYQRQAFQQVSLFD